MPSVGSSLKGKAVGLIELDGIGKAQAKRLIAYNMRQIGFKQHVDAHFSRAHHLVWIGSLAELEGGETTALWLKVTQKR